MITAEQWPVGLITALVTPMKDDEPDLEAMSVLVEQQIAAGARGVVVCGGTGEYGALSLEERERLAEAVTLVADGRLLVLVQTGTLATRDALRLIDHAGRVGADGLLVASPFGEPINWRERRAFYEEVDAATELPIMIYNTPPSGLLSFAQIVELAELEHVTAIKDSSGDMVALGDMLSWGELAVYVGWDCLLGPAVVSGANGALVGVGNFIASELSWAIEQLAQGSGLTGDAAAWWQPVRKVLRLMESSTNYVGLVKRGCALRGLDVGAVRAPYLMPPEGEAERLAELLSSLDRALGDVGRTPTGRV
jgi:4-hydroxy-tetrahydrodipicolinate synthase